MKILIISGFLGAGKTTFIKALARHTGKEFAVLENEYGAVGLDGEVLKKSLSNGEVNIWELTEGCICCSTKGDFAASVLTIANTVDPEYLVIEPTGVGMLSNIVANLKQIEYERISLLAPITIVDGQSFVQSRQEYPTLYMDQVSHAYAIVVSKMENADDAEKKWILNELSGLNPTAEIWTDHYSTKERSEWMRFLETGFDGSTVKANENRDDNLPDTFSLKSVDPDRPERLILLLENAIRGRYGNIARAKGIVRTGEIGLRYDLVEGRYMIIGEELPKESKMVFIGTDIKRQIIRRDLFTQ